MRSQIFRQIVQRGRRKADALLGRIVQDDGKYASRCATKPLGGLCAVLPKALNPNNDTKIPRSAEPNGGQLFQAMFRKTD
jgi:hypothetical protein